MLLDDRPATAPFLWEAEIYSGTVNDTPAPCV
jgi:hypothetical protein